VAVQLRGEVGKEAPVRFQRPKGESARSDVPFQRNHCNGPSRSGAHQSGSPGRRCFPSRPEAEDGAHCEQTNEMRKNLPLLSGHTRQRRMIYPWMNIFITAGSEELSGWGRKGFILLMSGHTKEGQQRESLHTQRARTHMHTPTRTRTDYALQLGIG